MLGKEVSEGYTSNVTQAIIISSYWTYMMGESSPNWVMEPYYLNFRKGAGEQTVGPSCMTKEEMDKSLHPTVSCVI